MPCSTPTFIWLGESTFSNVICRHLARGEGVVGDQRRPLGEGYGHVGLTSASRSSAPKFALLRRGGPLARAERLLAADVERQLRPQLALGLAQEAGETAEMVVVPVAQHQRVERGRVDAKQIRIVDQRLGREAVVDQDVAEPRRRAGSRRASRGRTR